MSDGQFEDAEEPTQEARHVTFATEKQAISEPTQGSSVSSQKEAPRKSTEPAKGKGADTEDFPALSGKGKHMLANSCLFEA
jgi:hypothetical protein